VSLMSMKRQSPAPDSAKQRALDAAAQMVPMAKNAGLAARTGAEGAVAWAAPRVQDARAWATPHVNDARSWAAPHVEQAGIVVRDKLAPTISAALVEAARRLDVSPRRRRWPRVLAGVALVAAAGSAIAAVVLRRRSEVTSFGAEGYASPDSAMPSSGETHGTKPGGKAQANGSGDEAEANARVHKS
jgi:hypothetical protein